MDLSAKALDAEGARRLIKELIAFDVDVVTLIKDGDATSRQKAEQMKTELLASMTPGRRAGFCSDIKELLCCRHYGKNTIKRVQSSWKKHWTAPKAKTCAYLRGTINRIIKKNKGNVAEIKKKIDQLIPHLKGDHANCSGDLLCKSGPDYEQTLLISDDNVLDMLKTVIDDRYNSAKLGMLQWDVTTNGNESLNGDLIALFPKRLYSKNGARYDNYSILVPLRRIYGRKADVIILRLMGFSVTDVHLRACEKIDDQQLSNRIHRIVNKGRRKQIRKMRSGWDNKRGRADRKAGYKYKDDVKTNKRVRKKRKESKSSPKKKRPGSDDESQMLNEGGECGAVGVDVVDDEIPSDSDAYEHEEFDEGSNTLVSSRAELLNLQRMQEEFMRDVQVITQKSDRAARMSARSKRH